MDKDGYNNSPDALRAEYERGFVEGMSHQAKSSVDRAVNAMSKREWKGLTGEDIQAIAPLFTEPLMFRVRDFAYAIDQFLKERNT